MAFFGKVRRWDGGWSEVGQTPSPMEVPIAIVLDASTQAVLMATPRDLQDFAAGFALTEGLIGSISDIIGFDEVDVTAQGLPAREARLWLRPGLAADLSERRRQMLGPVGCGLCGVDSIAAALPQIVKVSSSFRMTPRDVARAMRALGEGQALRRHTSAIHGAAFWNGHSALVREDVGRHNALDKAAGAVLRGDFNPAQGAVVMSSRISVDLVQKVARMGVPVLIGASAPTGLAVEWADRAGITLIARAREEAFELYTHPQRVSG